MLKENLKRPHLVNYFLYALLMTFLVAACTQGDNFVPNKVLVTEYQLVDFMMVNSEVGTPQKSSDQMILSEKISLYDDGSFISHNNFTTNSLKKLISGGKWEQKESTIIFYHQDGKVLGQGTVEGEDLNLAQDYSAFADFADGTIFYSFKKS